jgi:hypothetical protein
MAQSCILDFNALLPLCIVENLKCLLACTCTYYAHSPKHYIDFIMLPNMMKTKGLKIFLYCKTRWIFLLKPLRRVLSEYRTLLPKLLVD